MEKEQCWSAAAFEKGIRPARVWKKNKKTGSIYSANFQCPCFCKGSRTMWKSSIGFNRTVLSAFSASLATGRTENIHGELTTVGFVRFVLAVGVSVALPVHVDALAAAALELSQRAPRFLRLRPPAAALHGLVRLVLAVGVAVAAPQGRDALGVVAAELVLAAGWRRAFLLVAGVPAVVVAVAHEDGSHASAVAALEVFGGTRLGIWGAGEAHP